MQFNISKNPSAGWLQRGHAASLTGTSQFVAVGGSLVKGNTVTTVTDGVSWRAGATAAFNALLRLVPAMASQSVFASKLQPGRHFRKISGSSRDVNNIGQTATKRKHFPEHKKKKKSLLTLIGQKLRAFFKWKDRF